MNWISTLICLLKILFFNRLDTVLFPANELFSLANRNMKQVFLLYGAAVLSCCKLLLYHFRPLIFSRRYTSSFVVYFNLNIDIKKASRKQKIPIAAMISSYDSVAVVSQKSNDCDFRYFLKLSTKIQHKYKGAKLSLLRPIETTV